MQVIIQGNNEMDKQKQTVTEIPHPPQTSANFHNCFGQLYTRQFAFDAPKAIQANRSGHSAGKAKRECTNEKNMQIWKIQLKTTRVFQLGTCDKASVRMLNIKPHSCEDVCTCGFLWVDDIFLLQTFLHANMLFIEFSRTVIHSFVTFL